MSIRRKDRCYCLLSESSGKLAALELFKATPDDFGLVITDMNMPQMTGDKLSSELMKIRPDIPIMLCSGFSKKISEEKVSETGIRALLKKPVLKPILAETIRKVIDEANISF